MRIDDVEIGTHYQGRYGGRLRVDGITTVTVPVYGYGLRERRERRLVVMPVDQDTGEPPEGQDTQLKRASDLKRPWDDYAAIIAHNKLVADERNTAADRLNAVLPVSRANVTYAGTLGIRLSLSEAHEFAAWLEAHS